MQRLFERITTYYRLGLTNLLNVAIYRWRIKRGHFVQLTPIQPTPTENKTFFVIPKSPVSQNLLPPNNKAFGWLAINNNQVPDWHASLINGKRFHDNTKHWSRIGDFELALGDIKAVWEQSRFNWLFTPTVLYLSDNNPNHIAQLNHLLNSWLKSNPVNQGVNWKCGQEASIRVIHLVATHQLLSSKEPASEALAQLIFQHLSRIAPTIAYAVAQDNNHGTSEACALYVGAMLLKQSPLFRDEPSIQHWYQTGRDALEERCQKLIASDGCFSQNSSNYHRLMLDTLCFAEYCNQFYCDQEFSNLYYQKAQDATRWLAHLVDDKTGLTPILGLNDGAQLLPVTSCDYLDFRPSVQWASQLFLGNYAFDIDGPFNQLANMFAPSKVVNKSALFVTQLTSDYHSLNNESWRLFLRTPTQKFRPSQCDALHLDIWHQSRNLCVSTGSYSYNCEAKWQNYFPSTKAQNTVCFDDQEQMPKLSRFLYNNWIKTKVILCQVDKIIACYRNKQGHYHQRTAALQNNLVKISDNLSGFERQATLRWHLPNEPWQLESNKLTAGKYVIEINADVPITKLNLVDGWQSRYYQYKTKINVLEVVINKPGTITTKLSAT